MAFGMIEVMISLFVIILMLIGQEIEMIGKALVEEHSFLAQQKTRLHFIEYYRGKVCYSSK